jgi:hypothetical protein
VASVVVGVLEKLREKARQGHQSMRQREGRMRERSGGERGASPRRRRWRLAAGGLDSGEEFRQPGGVFCRGKSEERERRSGVLIGSSLDGHLLAEWRGEWSPAGVIEIERERD